jgi:WS/DGAT/MGAT family acyltransferase
MTDVEALMWNLERDPQLSASIANITVLDTAPDRDRLLARLRHAVAMVPRLHQHVIPTFGRLAPPQWRSDPTFDVERHVRWARLAAPGSMRTLLDEAADIVAQPFDRQRPLWEFVVLEGLEGGRAAMVQKLHHAITDGEGGLRMSEQFIDVERDAAGPLAPPRPPPPSTDGTALDTVLDTLTHQARRAARTSLRAAQETTSLALHPTRALQRTTEAVELGRSALRQAVVTDRSHSPLWTERSLRRRVEVIQVPFAEAKAASRALGGSLNDLFVTAAAGAAGAVHRRAGLPVDELRISMPVSTRHDRSAGGNAFTPTRVLVPVSIEDPVERFHAIRDRLAPTRSEPALDLANGLAGLANLLPPALLLALVRRQVQTVDFAVSNVRGASFPLYIAGARMEANYPLGPTGGTAWNLTLMSYDGHLDLGLNVDEGAVADPEALRDAIEEELRRLMATGGQPVRRARRGR